MIFLTRYFKEITEERCELRLKKLAKALETAVGDVISSGGRDDEKQDNAIEIASALIWHSRFQNKAGWWSADYDVEQASYELSHFNSDVAKNFIADVADNVARMPAGQDHRAYAELEMADRWEILVREDVKKYASPEILYNELRDMLIDNNSKVLHAKAMNILEENGISAKFNPPLRENNIILQPK